MEKHHHQLHLNIHLFVDLMLVESLNPQRAIVGCNKVGQVRYMTAMPGIAMLAMPENHIKTNIIGLQGVVERLLKPRKSPKLIRCLRLL